MVKKMLVNCNGRDLHIKQHVLRILTLCTPGDGLPTLRKLPYAARSLLTDGTVYERSGW